MIETLLVLAPMVVLTVTVLRACHVPTWWKVVQAILLLIVISLEVYP